MGGGGAGEMCIGPSPVGAAAVGSLFGGCGGDMICCDWGRGDLGGMVAAGLWLEDEDSVRSVFEDWSGGEEGTAVSCDGGGC